MLRNAYYIAHSSITSHKPKPIKKFMKWTIVSISFVVALLLIAIFSLQGKTFEAPFPDNIVAVKDSATIARGQYLAYGPAHCATVILL